MKNANYAKLREVFQIIFTLSHGQAALERGFLINNELGGKQERGVINC